MIACANSAKKWKVLKTPKFLENHGFQLETINSRQIYGKSSQCDEFSKSATRPPAVWACILASRRFKIESECCFLSCLLTANCLLDEKLILKNNEILSRFAGFQEFAPKRSAWMLGAPLKIHRKYRKMCVCVCPLVCVSGFEVRRNLFGFPFDGFSHVSRINREERASTSIWRCWVRTMPLCSSKSSDTLHSESLWTPTATEL